MTENEVPEGQVPRDVKFWNTFYAVSREQQQAWTRIECVRKGHPVVYGCGGGEPKCDCGMNQTQVAELMERQGRGHVIRDAEGNAVGFRY
jgi:hypothetical protein